jgi:hypothetical protein
MSQTPYQLPDVAPRVILFFSPLSPLSPPPPSPRLPPRPVARFTPHAAASTGGRIHGDRPFPTPAAGLQAAGLLPLPSRRLLRTGAEAAAALLPLSAERQGRRRRGGGATGAAARRRSSTVRSVSTRATPPPALELGRAEGSTRSELLFLAVASDTTSASTKVGAALSSGGRALAEVLARRGCWGRLARVARRLQLSRICSGGHGGPTAPRLRDSKCGREALGGWVRL